MKNVKYNPAADIMAATGKSNAARIQVKFRGRENTAVYTVNIMGLLKTDPAVEWIIDNETGEVLYFA